MRIFKLISILTTICLISLSINVCGAPIISPRYYIKANIIDMWMDGYFCHMKIIITEIPGNYSSNFKDYWPENYGYEIGKKYEITVSFYMYNGSNYKLNSTGSHGHKIGDTIEGYIYEVGDEWGTEFYMFALAKSDKNFAKEKTNEKKFDSYPIYYLIIIFIILLAITILIIYFKKWRMYKTKSVPSR